MSDTQIASDAVVLDTRIPESRRIDGLEYGAHVSRTTRGWSGYYVRPAGTDRWGVARLTPDDGELPQTQDGETADEAVVRAIAAEMVLASTICHECGGDGIDPDDDDCECPECGGSGRWPGVLIHRPS